MNNNNLNSCLQFYLNDNYNNTFIIYLEFYKSLVITAINQTCFPKKIYTGSFDLIQLKNHNKFFRIYDSIFETFNDLNSLIKQNKFFILNQEQIITLCIEKQIGFQNDIIFPLKEKEANINEIVYELCDKYLNLEKRVANLEKKIRKYIFRVKKRAYQMW